jgi:hypothetical protein
MMRVIQIVCLLCLMGASLVAYQGRDGETYLAVPKVEIDRLSTVRTDNRCERTKLQIDLKKVGNAEQATEQERRACRTNPQCHLEFGDWSTYHARLTVWKRVVGGERPETITSSVADVHGEEFDPSNQLIRDRRLTYRVDGLGLTEGVPYELIVVFEITGPQHFNYKRTKKIRVRCGRAGQGMLNEHLEQPNLRDLKDPSTPKKEHKQLNKEIKKKLDLPKIPKS